MVEAETFFKTLDLHSVLTWPIAQEGFMAFSSHESFKSSWASYWSEASKKWMV